MVDGYIRIDFVAVLGEITFQYIARGANLGVPYIWTRRVYVLDIGIR